MGWFRSVLISIENWRVTFYTVYARIGWNIQNYWQQFFRKVNRSSPFNSKKSIRTGVSQDWNFSYQRKPFISLRSQNWWLKTWRRRRKRFKRLESRRRVVSKWRLTELKVKKILTRAARRTSSKMDCHPLRTHHQSHSRPMKLGRHRNFKIKRKRLHPNQRRP